MPRLAQILERLDGEPGEIRFAYAVRAAVPAMLRVADPTATTAFRPRDAAEEAAELAALRSGQLVEVRGVATIPATGTAVEKRTAARQAVEAAQTALANAYLARAAWPLEGQFLDSVAGWVT